MPSAASSSPISRSAATPDIELRTLRDGGQTALEIAEYAAGFLTKAESSLEVPTKQILGVPDLMHHKYVVRDGADVWTGSTNWSDDSWSREENVIVVVHSAEVAARYTEDFEQLWETESVEQSGLVEPNPVRVFTGVTF